MLDFIEKFSEENGYSPSLTEISKYLKKSLSTVQHYLEELQLKGYLHKEENIARGITTASGINTGGSPPGATFSIILYIFDI